MRVTWVIPCYNEAERLDDAQVAALVARDGVHALLVDDGSSDATPARLAALAAGAPAVSWLGLPVNRGKAEAVRQGMLRALADGADAVGYLDADFATPASEAHRLAAHLERDGVQVVMGARIARLGADIDRSEVRHYLGRVFATVASIGLSLPVYDTQCGAKLFRRGTPLDEALAAPFTSRWAFDVELIGRLLDAGMPTSGFVEVPLDTWRDVAGSKLAFRGMVRAGADVLRIAWRRRVGSRRGP